MGLALLALLAVAGCSEDRKAMVATANPHASRAAFDILQKGGSAIDAAIAAQMVLTLVEPQSSGIGGGLFLLHWDNGTGVIDAWDGRETAPGKAGTDYFLKANGEPMKWRDASIGGRPVGVPGVVAALWQAHRRSGALPWKELFRPAIALAENGFAVSPRLNEAITKSTRLLANPEAVEIYFTQDEATIMPLPVGATLKNPKLANTLRQIADAGPDAFYKGPVAERIVSAVTTYPGNPSLMSLEDLASYQAKHRAAVCSPYRRYRVCGMPPPTSGGLTSLMILGILENYDLGALRPNSPMAAHLFTQASRLAYADRAAYMADADFVDVPVEGLLDKTYLRKRAGLIDPLADMGEAAAGTPPMADEDLRRAADAGLKEYGTTHLAIVDVNGNAVSMTSSVEQRFGSHISVNGFILNSQLTDFAFVAEKDGVPVANRVQPKKRPRSSMSPTLVFNEGGELFAAIGSPGGSRIITYVTQSLIALLDWNMNMQNAINMPHVLNRNRQTEVEQDTGLDELAARLRVMGHDVKVRPLVSGLHGVRITHDGMDGGADPRREGIVLPAQ
jgi:gamma-glutamyltranspeptidase/glutathione hydrolase